MAAIVHNMPGGGMDPIELMVTDYVRCFVLQENPEPKVLLEAIVLAVEHGELVKSLVSWARAW